ncbi:MAG: methyltransferase domain-containing protein [Acidobacteria bacterium]|nr:methyltransferase domain-containing protein [Acidobacteriota bacterium]
MLVILTRILSRDVLLQLLDAHRPFTNEEAEMTQRLRAFVEAHEACFERTLQTGHITGSAWVLDRDRTHTLLTHHGKLDKWLQLGGHSDGDSNTLRVALREATEESGLQGIRPISTAIFDIDIHLIPARKRDPEHYHYDVRFLLEADRSQPLRMTDESKDLQWVPLVEVEQLTQEESVLRMVRKTSALTHGERILDQFTRQAVPFATAPAIRNEQALDRIVTIVNSAPTDTVLDVACGPGLLVCAFAPRVQHVTGIDITPAMLDQARQLQQQRALTNITWCHGNVESLPFPDAHFTIVASRFAIHHMQNPMRVIEEMHRVCTPGGQIVIADSAPAANRADAFNQLERLRDPSHVRAFPMKELSQMIRAAGFSKPITDFYRLESELDNLLSRSFPNQGDANRIREMIAASLDGDTFDMAAHRREGKLYVSFPVGIIAPNGICKPFFALTLVYAPAATSSHEMRLII